MRFRGRTKAGKIIEGYYCKLFTSPDRHFIVPEAYESGFQGGEILKHEISGFIEIIPESLAMQTGQLDKNKKPIFGSIELEDGTMSRGGDRVMLYGSKDHDYTRTMPVECIVKWFDEASCFELSEIDGKHSYGLYKSSVIEIIGNQMDEKEK